MNDGDMTIHGFDWEHAGRDSRTVAGRTYPTRFGKGAGRWAHFKSEWNYEVSSPGDRLGGDIETVTGFKFRARCKRLGRDQH